MLRFSKICNAQTNLYFKNKFIKRLKEAKEAQVYFQEREVNHKGSLNNQVFPSQSLP